MSVKLSEKLRVITVEEMRFEMVKAVASGINVYGTEESHQSQIEACAALTIKIADAILKQLNKE